MAQAAQQQAHPHAAQARVDMDATPAAAAERLDARKAAKAAPPSRLERLMAAVASAPQAGLFFEKQHMLVLLQRLHGMVGMASAKDAVADQISFLCANNGSADGHMLNTIITGPPGVGKTALGALLAEIWLHLGAVRPAEPAKPAAKTTRKEHGARRRGPPMPITTDPQAQKIQKLLLDTIFAQTDQEDRMVSGASNVLNEAADLCSRVQYRTQEMRQSLLREKFMPYHDQAALGQHRPRGAAASSAHPSFDPAAEPWHKMCDPLLPCKFTALAEHAAHTAETCGLLAKKLDHALQELNTRLSTDEKLARLVVAVEELAQAQPADAAAATKPAAGTAGPAGSAASSRFKIVSRADFVGEFMGVTAVKTRTLLEQNRGKVLFVDEAYSLYQGDRDLFGAEAVHIITQFMSEEPDAIRWIFAGYEDMFNSSIFLANPGMRRRFAWCFKVPGYTPDELRQIFLGQLRRHAYAIAPEVPLDRLFSGCAHAFTNYGGDTERFLFQCKLAHARSAAVLGAGAGGPKLITGAMLDEALADFLQNVTESQDKMSEAARNMFQ